MEHTARILETAHEIYARANTTSTDSDSSRPASYKAIGISLAVGSGLFIGVSFVLKKVGLLKANEKYNEAAGEGYSYLKNAYWWGGMSLMILGEILNFVAYAFTEAILVTSLGALSVVITTILSAIFLKERLSMVGKVACFLCIVGSVVIVLNAPQQSSVSDIQEMQSFVITPGFLSYAGVIILGAAFLAFWAGPRYGKKNMFTYISICSWVGGLSVSATQGLGAAIVAQIGGEPQFNHWFLYVLFVFIVGTLLTEIIFLNKALNLFNAAMVTPTYYVYFTSTTIITSAVLFRGFKGTATQIITVVFGFLTICSGVILLQLSKSAKDVPDTAVFAGDLNQIQTIAEQEQPETEPKADALRGSAAILRSISNATRSKMEHEEFKRLREDKEAERLATVSEDGEAQYQWDGLRRRRTTLSSQRSRTFTAPSPANTPHLPMGRSRLPTEEELEEERMGQTTPNVLTSIAGTIRSRARSVLIHRSDSLPQHEQEGRGQSPMHPVQLKHINVAGQKYDTENSPYGYGAPQYNTEYGGAASVTSRSTDRHIQFSDTVRPSPSNASLVPPTPPPHGEEPRAARRQFSFQNVFRRHQADRAQEPAPPSSSHSDHLSRLGLGSRGYSDHGLRVKDATEEERLGLVKGDSNSRSMPALPSYDEEEDLEDSDEDPFSDERRASRYGRGITGGSPQRRAAEEKAEEDAMYAESRRRWGSSGRNASRDRTPSNSPPRPPPQDHSPPRGGNGAFL
ncbi:DUF803-domain-containing protein [Xylariaceae sp. FL0255]|nr:DUF803-domain-containing protein [Xylariaceae sp. FL0255]